ncbi:MAG TPA: tyrosine-type recombinase/integrase [Clostridiales bacterium]|nr:tyrosine-type recombinase/integrase [Clostridiales bacterium]
MQNSKPYSIHQNKLNIIKLRRVIKDLPPFCAEYFRGIEPHTSILTRINYGYDLRLFFHFITNEVPEFKDKTPQQLTIEDMKKIEPVHLEMFLEYITLYNRPGDNDASGTENHESGKARKLSAIRSCFSHFYKKGYLDRNVTELVDIPKIHEKAIIRLDVDEVARLLDSVENGEGLTPTQRRYHKYTRQRDLTLLTLFLGTGIRISECVGLNISDFDFNNNGFKVTRKGGNQVFLYFGSEVRNELDAYLEERKKIQPMPGHEDALFLSLQRKRLSHRAIQNLVKKYARIISPLKKISPHKLRSTYGTTLYRETGDIYLVADVLGHKDVNTTRKHYAAISDDKRRMAARVVKLRDDDKDISK